MTKTSIPSWPQLADRVKRILKKQGWRQQRFAEAMKWDKSLTSRYLNCVNEPRLPRIIKVAEWCEKHGAN